MIELKGVKLPADAHDMKYLKKKLSRLCNVEPDMIGDIRILKKSIDARKKPNVFLIYSVAFSVRSKEATVIKRLVKKGHKAAEYLPGEPLFPYSFSKAKKMPRPVITGAGPAGLFAALYLCDAGLEPLIIERGKPVEKRQRDIETFFEKGVLDPDSNVAFGEGGAGTFSDGKLNTLINDKTGKCDYVLKRFYEFGADESVLYDAKPHIGTDRLVDIIKNIRAYINARGGEFLFETALTGLKENDGRLVSLTLSDGREIATNNCILAIGHGARDTFRLLYESGIKMTGKAFAVGFRVEHPQGFINESQYATAKKYLPAAPYKVATKLKNGRGVYSFCMCPGGYVVNASTEDGCLVTNGMSYSGRNGDNANSAIIVSVGEKEFSLSEPLSAIEYQRTLEKKAYSLCDGLLPQQLFGDYVRGVISKGYGGFPSAHKGRAAFANLRGLLSEEIEQSFFLGMQEFDKKIHGFAASDVIMTGIESRTSSPVRILRDDTMQSGVRGLYPCGEGAGYAGGIMSAAMDGINCAAALINAMRESGYE